jgi:hypothetical protein
VWSAKDANARLSVPFPPPPPTPIPHTRAQVLLLLVSFAAVPWMLLPKPLILKKRHEAMERSVSVHLHVHPPHARTGCMAVLAQHVLQILLLLLRPLFPLPVYHVLQPRTSWHLFPPTHPALKANAFLSHTASHPDCCGTAAFPHAATRIRHGRPRWRRG